MRKQTTFMHEGTSPDRECPSCPDSPDTPVTSTVAAETRAITQSPGRGAGGKWLRGTASPNPHGRPSIPVEVKEAAKAHTLDMIAVLVEVASDKDAPPSARVAAASAVLDRGHGKPVASVEAKVAKVDLSQMHLEALRSMMRDPLLA